MSKLGFEDSVLDVFIKMYEGVPGALQILTSMANNPEAFAPADPLMVMLKLDTLEIYGSDIWSLGHYVCKDDMNQLSLVMDNHTFGYLSTDVLKYHIKHCLPFEKLYSEEEMKADDLLDPKLPRLEPNLAQRLSEAAEKEPASSKTAPDALSFQRHFQDALDFAGSQKASSNTPPRNIGDMQTDQFISLLEERGFRLGFEMPETYDNFGKDEKLSFQVYYQPDENMVVGLHVPEDKNSRINHVAWFAGDVYTQRDSHVEAEANLPSCSRGGFRLSSEKTGYYYSKDIRDDFFDWYDKITVHTQPLAAFYPDVEAPSLSFAYFPISSSQSNYHNDYNPEHYGIGLYGPFSDICRFYNLSQVKDKGLKKMFAPSLVCIKDEAQKAIFELANTPDRTETPPFNWLMDKLGIDEDWFRQHGVDVDLALTPPQDYKFKFNVTNVHSEPGKTQADIDMIFDKTVRDFRDQVGKQLNPEWPRNVWDFKPNNRLTYSLKGINSLLSCEEAAAAMQKILKENGIEATIRVPPLHERIASAMSRQASQSHDSAQGRAAEKTAPGR